MGPNASGTGQSGKYGLEKYYNGLLDGASSTSGVGTDLTTTIDPNIQIEAEKILDDLVQSTGATGGDVMVMDPMTGKILAMGGDPNFDPNNYSQSPLADFLNTDVQGVYEPGSIMKLLTMAAGIDSGKITPDTTYDDKGYVNVDGAHITNYNLTTQGAYGDNTTMTEVIEHSINSGAIWAENATGNSIFLSYLKKFGFDRENRHRSAGRSDGEFEPAHAESAASGLGHGRVRAGHRDDADRACDGGRRASRTAGC